MGTRISIIIGLLISAFFTTCLGQSLPLLIGDKDFTELDFEYANGMIVIKTFIDEQYPYNLILDTGAENLILFDLEKVEALGYPSSKRIELRGADLDTFVTAHVCRQIPFQLPDCNTILRDFIVLEKDLLDLENSIGTKVDGILGGRALWGLVLEIDYDHGKVRIYKQSHLRNIRLNKYHKLDLEIKNHKPYIHTQLQLASGAHVDTKLLLDSGSSLGFLLLLDSDPTLKLPEKHIKGPIGRGLAGDIIGYITRIKALRISEGLFFPGPITHLQEKGTDITDEMINYRNGLIGNPLLSKFSIIIDYLSERLYLRPIRGYNKESDFDKSGLFLNAIGPNLNEFVVRYVLENTPAADADIRKGDIISRLGWFPIKWRNLSKVTQKLSAKEGKQIRMKVIRDGLELNKSIILRDYLKNLQN